MSTRKRPRSDEDPQSVNKFTPLAQQQSDPQDYIPPDAAATIDTEAAIAYWSTVTPDDAGVLGGYPHVSRADLQGSLNFLGKMRRAPGADPAYRSSGVRFGRVVDCGAGIGRVTLGCLSKIAEVVDVVEPVKRLTDVITEGEGFATLRKEGRIGEVYNVGIQEWTPARKYDIIWTQWCCGQLTDGQLVEYFVRCKPFINPGGWLVVKENMSTDPDGRDIFDGTDNSVTRTDRKFREMFKEAGLRVVLHEVQNGMPREIYPIRSYALQPESKG